MLGTIPLEIPQKLIVIPFLRPLENTLFQTFRDFVAFFTQISEVGSFQHPSSRINSDRALDQNLQFMHEQNIAHRGGWTLTNGRHCTRRRDCTVNNIMIDPSEMSPQMGQTRRYVVDFGLSRQYPSRQETDEPLRVGDKSVPEHRNGTRCNPFYTDIYYLGNLVRREFIQVRLAMPIIARHNNITPMDHVIRSTTASSLCKTWLMG